MEIFLSPLSFLTLIILTVVYLKKKLLFYTLYAQGTPFLICSLTAIVDSFSSGKYAQDLLHYPEMGVYSCFLGSMKTGGRVSYFERPEFIYFSSFILMILIINALLLALTTSKLVESWKNQAELRKIQQRCHHNIEYSLMLQYRIQFDITIWITFC